MGKDLLVLPSTVWGKAFTTSSPVVVLVNDGILPIVDACFS